MADSALPRQERDAGTGSPPRRRIPRNLWAASVTSFLTDVSTEMVVNVLPLFLANVLGVRTAVIGLIEGVAASTASLVNVFSGALSDRMRSRKWLAVAGYALSTLAKPGFALATTWGGVAAARWADRMGKGVRTAPRDALVADSIRPEQRGLAFGFHRAADTGGAVVGLLVAVGVVALLGGGAAGIERRTFQVLVLVSLVPAGLAVAALALGAREVGTATAAGVPRLSLRGLGRPFLLFLGVSALFDLGNFSEAFAVLRAQQLGASVGAILWMLVVFNLVYALVSTPAGSLADRIGRRGVLAGGWLFYALVQIGFAAAGSAVHLFALFGARGVYAGLSVGTAKALLADLVPAERRATAYGCYAAVLGLVDLPASFVAGVLWQGLGSWRGFGPAAPFWFAAATAGLASLLLGLLVSAPDPPDRKDPGADPRS